ncbi:putative HMP/thiamine permease protein YkoC [Haloarcula mannanilytica]|uniref:Putative HMP/thiamine permease protein YkoC n=1 Tax=Haloarcula mannanilytica TaxID=2509225 RepID=A0A4C2EVH5_9EURY|nr:energy-coupling factor transporter transmembrane component T [Haloarcula mannanilytica]GCF16219.1 putative HMP/thiamine permease protein YkoC [Haloarcula mannanilytica]
MRAKLNDQTDEAGVLQRLNPVSKLLAITPAMGVLMLVTDPYTPLAFVAFGALVTIVLGRLSPVDYLRVAGPLVALAASFLFVYPFVVGSSAGTSSDVFASLGPLAVRESGLRVGVATGLRILALSILSLLFVLTTETESFLRALVQNLGLPYRIGYSAIAAFRFAPKMRSDVETIRAAHTVRGTPDTDSLRDRLHRMSRYAIPLFVNAIRRAERTALAMDARAFGAYDERTHYRTYSITSADITFVVFFWTLSVGIVLTLWYLEALGTLTILR